MRVRATFRSFPASCAGRRTTRSASRSSACWPTGRRNIRVERRPSSPRCETSRPRTWPMPVYSTLRVSMPNVRKPVAESYWVIPDRLLAGRYPGGKNPRETERRIAAFVEAGFDTFLDLTEAGELPPYDIYLPGRVEHFRRPIPDHGVPRAPEHMADALAVLRNALAAGRRVYVHCRAGIGRTGTVVACHLMDCGLEPRDALIQLNELWQDNERSHTWPDVPETDEQRDYILNWAAPTTPAPPPAQPVQIVQRPEPARTREPELPLPRFEIPDVPSRRFEIPEMHIE